MESEELSWSMQVGDVVKFNISGHIGTIVELDDSYNGVCLYISGDVSFKNPTWMGKSTLLRVAEFISEYKETNS